MPDMPPKRETLKAIATVVKIYRVVHYFTVVYDFYTN